VLGEIKHFEFALLGLVGAGGILAWAIYIYRRRLKVA
jgi:hypothetical protein